MARAALEAAGFVVDGQVLHPSSLESFLFVPLSSELALGIAAPIACPSLVDRLRTIRDQQIVDFVGCLNNGVTFAEAVRELHV